MVSPVQYAVKGERNLSYAHAPQRVELLFVHGGAGNAIGQLLLRSLYADLDVVEAVLEQPIEQRLVEERSLSNQVGVEARTRRGADERGEVAAQRRFAAREVRLDDA